MTDDRWMRAAYADDAVVAELLVRLKHSSWDFSLSAMSNPQSSRLPVPQYGSLLPLTAGWGHRQPRSKPVSTTATASVAAAAATPTSISCLIKEREPATRCSPTTPLSWSSASTSDESSRPSDLSSGDRSKAVFPVESETAKKSRKRKSFAELKEVEGFLLEERTHLKTELESMQGTFKQQIATSANLKRFKHGLHIQPGNNVGKRLNKIDYQFNQTEASSSFNHSHSTMRDYRLSILEKDIETQERGFIVPDLNAIPDLNMSPTEEETGGGNSQIMS